MTQTERDLKAELDSLDSYEPAPTEWPQSAPENSAVKALGVEDTIAQEVEQTRQGVKQEAEKSFLSNFFDSVVSTVRDYRGPLADDFEKNMPGGLPIPGGLEGLDFIARRTTGVAPTDAVTGNVDEFTKGTNRGFYNTMSSFAGGVEQYGKTLGSETITGYAGERKEAFKGKAEKEYFKPRIEGLKDISKETWFSDAVDYAISGVGEGMGSSAPFLAVGSVTGLPGAMAFGYTSSVGELRDELISNGITDEATVQKYAYIAAVPHAMLDQLTERGVLKSLTDEARKEATKGIVRLVVNGVAKGVAKEGVTEAAQRVIEIGAVAHAKGGEAPNAAVVAAIFADVEKGTGSTILESGVKGALPGGVFGLGEVAADQMKPVQEARVRTPNTATDATPVAPADTRAVAPMREGPAQKGMPGATSEPATFSEPELEAARKAIQDAAQGLPVETAPEGSDIESRIAQAAFKAGGNRWNTRALIADIHEALPDVPLPELQEALRRMQRDEKLILYRNDSNVEVMQDPRQANTAISFVGEPRHIVWVPAESPLVSGQRQQPQAATVEPETAPLTQEDADAIVQEADQVIADAIADEDLDLPAVFAEVEDYLAENEIQVDDIADEAVREIAQAVYNGEDLGVAVDRALVTCARFKCL